MYFRLDEIGYPCGYEVIKINPADAARDATSFLKLCKSGKPEDVAEAIRLGADVNAVTEDGYTALMTIFDTRLEQSPDVRIMQEAVTALLDNGADTSIRNKDGKTAHDLTDKFAYFKNTESYKRVVSL